MSEHGYRYRHLGLSLAADAELPALQRGGAEPVDVRVDVRRAAAPPALDDSWREIDPPRPTWRRDAPNGSHLRLHFAGVDGSWAEFLLSAGGERVELTLSPDVDLAEAAELLAANVFSCLLAQRGWTCLHASVVEVGGRAVAFVGPKGTGKSTLASHLTRAGAGLLSDDVAAIRPVDGTWQVAVGRPLARLTPESAASVGTTFEALDPVWDEASERPRKRFFDGGASASRPAVALDAVVMLVPRRVDARAELVRVTGQQMLPGLIANRHMAEVLDSAGQRRDFTALASLVTDRPVYELHRADSLGGLPNLAGVVLDRLVEDRRAN